MGFCAAILLMIGAVSSEWSSSTYCKLTLSDSLFRPTSGSI